MNKTRLEAFSDGVFAIIITIMVLEIKVPQGASWTSLQPLLPVFVSYLLSFIYIGIYWGNHHHLLHVVKRISPGIIWANFHLLFWLSLMPFVTGWMGENHFATNTVVLYAIILLVCGISYTMLQLAIQKHNPSSNELEAALKKVKLKGIISVTGYSVSILFAFISSIISGLIFLLIAILWLIPDRNIERAVKGE
jgi:uncharacterized membrane protein